MASLKKITVLIAKDGSTKIDAEGFTGDSCLKETASLEEALGKPTDRKLKPEAAKKTTIADKTKVGA